MPVNPGKINIKINQLSLIFLQRPSSSSGHVIVVHRVCIHATYLGKIQSSVKKYTRLSAGYFQYIISIFTQNAF